MATKGRGNRSVELSQQLTDCLTKAGGNLKAGDLVRRFCEENNDVRLEDAEIALSLLLNQRRLIVDDDLKLQKLEVAA